MSDKVMHNLYGGKIQVEHNKKRHTFKKQGERTYLISVTSCTKLLDKSKALLPAAIKVINGAFQRELGNIKGKQVGTEQAKLIVDECLNAHEKEWGKKRDIGIEAHGWFERFGKAKMGDTLFDEEALSGLSKEVEMAVEAFLKWYNSFKTFKFIGCEQLVYSKEHDYAGLADAIISIGGKKKLVDYKISDRCYSERRYQIAGLWNAYEEEHGKVLHSALIPLFSRYEEQDSKGNVIKEYYKVEPYELKREDYEKDLPAFLGLLSARRREKELARELYRR